MLLAVGVLALMSWVISSHRPGAGESVRAAGATHGLAALPLAARLAVSRGLGADLAGYRLARSRGGFRARNVQQGLTASFGTVGATVNAHAGVRASLSLRAIGFGVALHPVGMARPLARGNRVEYRRNEATEWFVNGPAGIEQGFTIGRAPAGDERRALTLAVGVSGSLQPKLGHSGAIVLGASVGTAALRYGDLSVSDASGRALPAHMTVKHGRVLISVDTRGARYPLTVDPLLNRVGELYASDGATSDELGWSIATSGDTVVVGEPQLNYAGIRYGAAYVFTEGVGGWATATQVTKLVASAPASEERFGYSVAISGETIVVGAPGRNGQGGVDGGVAYVFSEPAGGWTSASSLAPTVALENSEDIALYELGHSVAISGDTIVVGAPQYRDYVQNLTPEADGAAFVFQKPAGGWASASNPLLQTATLVAHESEEEEHGRFGESVAVGEEGAQQTIVVGAPAEPVGVEPDKYRRGIVFLYSRPEEGWANLKFRERFSEGKLTASPSNEFAELGASVSISGAAIVAGAIHEEVNNVKQGAAFVFTAPATGWSATHEQTQAAELTNAGGSESDEFGRSVSVEGSTVAVAGLAKPVFLFAMPFSGWNGELQPTAEYTAGHPAAGTGLYTVALLGGEAFVGNLAASPLEEKGNLDQGAVDVVPFAPAAITGAPGPSETTATVAGTVNPDQNEVVSCVVQYGTTSSYGSEVPCLSFPKTGTSASAVSAEITGLSPGVTYHYRVVASNVVDTSYGADATFTTSSKSSGAGEKTSTTPTSTIPTTTTTPTPSPPSLTTPPPNAPAVLEATRALACTTAQVALIDVIQQGSHVLITGAARQVLAGRQVSIRLLSTGKTVATPTVSSAGTFSATAPLPPAKVRGSNSTRYQASVGSLSSLALKLERRANFVRVAGSGDHVSIAGSVTGSFRAGTPVHIELRVTCAKYKTVATVKLSRSGTFSATVPAPSGSASQIAVYRAATTVLNDGRPFATYTLPTPPN